ncbi:MAG TPA: hypothetical protein VLV50_07370 [Stellaceae bacterium]|nr:hypothetical protein [Stellaceae bacterium]
MPPIAIFLPMGFAAFFIGMDFIGAEVIGAGEDEAAGGFAGMFELGMVELL